MLDVKRIRNDFDALAEKLATRGVAAETLNELKELDVKRRELLIKSEELKAQRNIASDGIAQASVTKKMLPNKSQQCKKSLQKLRKSMQNLLLSMKSLMPSL